MWGKNYPTDVGSAQSSVSTRTFGLSETAIPSRSGAIAVRVERGKFLSVLRNYPLSTHHALPGSAKPGLFAGQVDRGWWPIKSFEALGLTHDITLPSDLPPRAEL